MQLYQLFEAPLGSYDVVGDLTDRGSFRPTDQRIIQSEKTPEIIRNAFKHIKQTIDIVIIPMKFKVSDPLSHGERHGGVWPREVAARRLHRSLPAPSTPDAITMIYTHNEGAQRLSMTPWIMAHRIGHAIVFSDESAILDLYNTVLDATGVLVDELDVDPLDAAYAIGTMRSARTKTLNGYGEFVIECMAQYLITGQLRFTTFTDPVQVKTDHGVQSRGTKEYPFAPSVNEVTASVVKEFDIKMQRLFASLQGKAVVM